MLAVHLEGPGHMMHCVHIKFVRSTEERIIESRSSVSIATTTVSARKFLDVSNICQHYSVLVQSVDWPGRAEVENPETV